MTTESMTRRKMEEAKALLAEMKPESAAERTVVEAFTLLLDVSAATIEWAIPALEHALDCLGEGTITKRDEDKVPATRRVPCPTCAKYRKRLERFNA